MARVHSTQTIKGKPRVWRLDDESRKLTSPSRCKQCGAEFHDGRWCWPSEASAEAASVVCPACRQTNEQSPTGVLSLSGDYFFAHKDEIMHLIQHQVDHENKQHPMNRIIQMDQKPDAVTYSFTDMHLPKRVGNALKHAHSGELDIQYDEAICRATWKR
ncbi:BCAM0308 family protein [Pseudidiomarina sp.]|uniref:BCAM0308 family protein n=1 Tax=Pseudidiomarina sp. TaxID=2081707 RepID=UPI003A986DC4